MKKRMLGLLSLLMAVMMIGTLGGMNRASAIGGGSSSATFYAIWNDEDKSISFAAEEPQSGTYEAVTEVKGFIQNYKSQVRSIDFAFKNAADASEKISLGSNEAKGLFSKCESLTEIKNLTNLDTSAATSMNGMFNECLSLTGLDLSGFDTGNVTDMEDMFYKCEKIKSLDLKSFDTEKVTDMDYMFCGCKVVESINVSSFNTSNVKYFNTTFGNCWALKSIDVSNFDTSKAIDMYTMFGACRAITELDLSIFSTESIGVNPDSYPGLSGLVYGCTNLEKLNIRNMKTDNWSKCFQNGFTGCGKLMELTLGKETILDVHGRFAGCGLSGNWAKEDDLDTVYTTKELIEKFSSTETAEAGTYIRFLPEGHYYRTDGTLNKENVWEVHTPEEKFKGYCLNKARNGVGPFLDRVEITSDGQLLSLLDSDSPEATMGYAPLGNSMREALITLTYYGWPNDAAGIQKKYGLTDDEYMEVTQNAIWDFVDRYDNKSGYEGQSQKCINAYNELLQQRFANVPGQYEMYIYTTWDDRYQNLISLRSLTDGIYGGVEVFKQDELSDPLKGAEFTVYTLDGEEVGKMVSRADGFAAICETDSYKGLPAGDYMVKETKAPPGYKLSDIVYYFSITEKDKIVTLGKRSATSAERYMMFEDKEDEDYEGGGIEVKKTSKTGEPLIEAEFTIYKNGEEVMTIISGEDGIASTGKRDLPLGTYTIKETKAPAGYELLDEEKEFTISEDKQFIEGFVFKDDAKNGEVVLKARKNFRNGKLKGGEFTFKLMDMDGKVLQQAKNDAEGNVTFDPITYTPKDQGYVNYKIVEVKGSDSNIQYDSHEENVTVTIVDTGGDELKCDAVYDEDGAVFTNTKKTYIKKAVNGGKDKTITNFDQKFDYTITTVVPHDSGNFKVIDDLPDVLEFTGKEDFVIKVDGVPSDLDFSIQFGKFLLELDKASIEKYYGSELEITFSARVKKDADLSAYKTSDGYKINNVASCIIDDKTKLETETEEASIKLRPESAPTDKTIKEGEGKKIAKKAAKKAKQVRQRRLSPATGDSRDMDMFLLIMMISLALSVGLAASIRKRLGKTRKNN